MVRYSVWQGILAKYSGEVFWQGILARYSGRALDQVFQSKILHIKHASSGFAQGVSSCSWKLCVYLNYSLALLLRLGFWNFCDPQTHTQRHTQRHRHRHRHTIKRAAQLIEYKVHEGMKLCGKALWPGILVRYSGRVFRQGILYGKVFYVARYSSEVFW